MTNVETIAAGIRRLGSVFNPDILAATRAIYRPNISVTAAVERFDVAYGPSLRNKLDLFLPEGDASAFVMFVHGGGFTGGDKNEDGVFHANVGRFLARHGFVGVLPTYRLAPEVSWPSATHDVRDAIAWLRKSAPSLSTPPLPLFIIGQSAGACHVASWFFDSEARVAPLEAVAGIMLMSGYYNAVAPLPENIRAYFGPNAALYSRRSPLTHVHRTEVPFCLTVAQYDPGVIAARTFAFAEALSLRNGRSPELVWLRDHNHVSTVLSLGSPHGSAGAEMLRFLKENLPAEAPRP